MANGLKSVELVKMYKKQFPSLQKLICVLKQFLLQRDLNEVKFISVKVYLENISCIEKEYMEQTVYRASEDTFVSINYIYQLLSYNIYVQYAVALIK